MNRPLDDLSKLQQKTVRTSLKNGGSIQIVVVVATAFAGLYNIESIVFMGPICVVIGFIVALLNRDKIGAYKLLAYSPAVFFLGCFLVIFSFDISPSGAQVPVSILEVIYSIWLLQHYFSNLHRRDFH